MAKRYIPSKLKRELRKEALFGCVLCGSPIIEYHHIIPFHSIKKHTIEEMVVLCPEHHHRADCGEVPKEILYNAKQSPFNKSQESISKDFFLLDYSSLKIKAGSNIFIRTPNLIVVDDFTLLSISEEGDLALLNAKFFNRHNKLLAEIRDNEWIAYKSPELWDIQYSPGHLKINRNKGSILIEFKMNGNIIELAAQMYYRGFKINLKPNNTHLGLNSISNSIISDCQTGISISTRLDHEIG